MAPYLAPDRLDQLRQASISGVDLSGNAVITVPGKILVYVTGSPNRFRSSDPIRNVYTGATSLVARSLLVRPVAASLRDLGDTIRSLGGSLTPTTISKALRRLEEDVLIARRGGSARLVQPDALLDNLKNSYKRPRIARSFLGRTDLSLQEVSQRLNAADAGWVLSGQSSTSRYAVMPREPIIRIYCTSLPKATAALGSALAETDRFANVELRETHDPTIAFDARAAADNGATRFASPVQTYLELADGDKREQDAATQVRAVIMDEVRRAQASAAMVLTPTESNGTKSP